MNLEGFEDDAPELGVKFKINRDFAQHYDKSRRSEELMKLKARYGDVDLNKSDSDSETEDEDADELTPAVEQSWLKTLAALKSDDPRLYDDKTKFFDSEDETAEASKTKKTRKKKKKEEKLTLKDIDRKVMLERDGKYSDGSDDDDDMKKKAKGKSYYEEQDEIRQSIKLAQDDVLSDEDDGLLKVKVKTAAEKEAEEEEFRKFIKGQQADVDEKAVKDLSGLRDYWNREDMTEADKFLKDYILEKKYLAEESENSDSEDDDERHKYEMISDEEDIDRADKFELKYNHRFEEPDPEFIKSYPRTVESTMRSEKNTRKEQRAQVRERKEKEKKQKREELNRLRNLKRQELEEKLKSIQEKSGAESMPFTGEELDEDFDPEEHDKKMNEMFPEEDEEGEELVKPTFDYDPDIDDMDDWDKYKIDIDDRTEEQEGDPHTDEQLLDPEDPNFVMDADYDPNAATLNDRNFGLDGKSKRHKKRKNRLKKALEKKKPLFNPDSKSFEQYLDEYYGLECEDMIGDLKCRFPYRDVPANDYGLTVNEILSARDKELNSWSSIKKTVQYRTKEEEYKDIAKFRRKGHDVDKKKRLLVSVYMKKEEKEKSDEEVDNEEEDEAGPSTSGHAGETTELAEDNGQLSEEPPAKKSKKHVTNDNNVDINGSVPESASPKKKGSRKRKAKFKGKQNTSFTEAREDQKSRGMSFKRMEAYGMHSEVKRVKKLRARDRRRKE